MIVSTESIGAATIHVSPSGTGNGSSGNPTSLSQANTRAVAGDQVILQNGTYYGQIKPNNSGSAHSPIMYSSQERYGATINGQGGVNGPVADLSDKDHIVLDGFVLNLDRTDFVVNTEEDLYHFTTRLESGVYMTYGASNIELKNLKIRNAHYGIMAEAYLAKQNSKPIIENLAINNVEVYDIYQHCIHIRGNVEHVDIRNSNIHHCENQYNNNDNPYRENAFSFGIEINGGRFKEVEDGPYDVTIDSNEIHHNGVQGIRTAHTSNIIVTNNHVHNNGATGFQVEFKTKNLLVERNLFENNSRSWPFETGIWIGGSDNIIFQQNIVRGNMMGVYANGLFDSQYSHPAKNILIRRNVIYDNNHEPSDPHESNINDPARRALGLRMADITSSVVYNNSIVNNAKLGQSTLGEITFSNANLDFSMSNVYLFNNIVQSNASKYDVYFVNNNSDPVSLSRNLYYSTHRENIYRWHDNNYNLASFQSTVRKDLDSFRDDPKFTNLAQFDLTLQQNSPAQNAGKPLALTTSSGSGTTIPVDNPYVFTDGFNVTNGDSIFIGTNQRSIISIDYSGKTITVNNPLSWTQNQEIHDVFVTDGSNDIGAYEIGAIIQMGPRDGNSRSRLINLTPILGGSRSEIESVLREYGKPSSDCGNYNFFCSP